MAVADPGAGCQYPPPPPEEGLEAGAAAVAVGLGGGIGREPVRVKPPALVTTAAPRMVAVFSAVADAWPAEVLAGLLVLDDELPHAAVTNQPATGSSSSAGSAVCRSSATEVQRRLVNRSRALGLAQKVMS